MKCYGPGNGPLKIIEDAQFDGECVFLHAGGQRERYAAGSSGTEQSAKAGETSETQWIRGRESRESPGRGEEKQAENETQPKNETAQGQKKQNREGNAEKRRRGKERGTRWCRR